MAEIGTVYGTLSLSARGVSQQIISEMGSAGISGGQQASKGFLSSIAGVTGKVVGIAATGLAAVGGIVGGLALTGGISKALQIENATAKMTGLGNSTETVSAVMANALAAVKGTAFGLGDAASVASTALASGIKPGADMSKYLTLVADASTIAGTGLGEMGSIMGKVTNSGKVTNDVLNQFGDRGVGVLQMLAKEYGVTAEEMTNMVSKGKIDAETFNRVLTQNIGGAAQKSGDTTMGAFANMKSALSNLGMAISGGFFPLFKGIFNQVQYTLEGVTKRIKPAADAFGIWFQGKAGPAIAGFSTAALASFDKIIGSLSAFVFAFKAADGDITSSGFNGFMEQMGYVASVVFTEMRGGIWAFGAAWAANDGDITSSGFPGFMERAAFVVHGLVDAVGMLNFTSVQGFFDSIGPAAGHAGTAFSSIGESLTTLGPAFAAFGDQLPKITGAIAELAGYALTALVGGLAFLADNVDTIIAWMPAIVAGFIAWRIASSALGISNLAVNAAQALMVPLTTANNMLRLRAIGLERQHAIAMGQSTAAMNLTNGSIAGSIVAWTTKTAVMGKVKVAMLASAAAQWVMNSALLASPITWIVIGIIALIAAIILLVMNWDTVVAFLKGSWDGFLGWFTGIMDGFLGWWDGIWNGIVGLVQDIIGNVISWVSANWGLILSLFIGPLGLAIQWIVNHWGEITKFFSDVWQNIVDGVAGFITGFVNVFKGIVTFLQPVIDVFVAMFGALGAIFNFVLALVGFVVRGIVMLFQWWLGIVIGILTSIWTFIVSVWTNISNAIASALGFIGVVISTAWNAYIGLIVGVLTAIWGFVSTIWNNVLGFMGDVLSAIGSTISGAWKGFVGMISGPLLVASVLIMSIWNNVLGFLGGVLGSIGSTVSGAWNGVASSVSGAVGNVYTSVVNKFNEVVSWLGGIGGRILGAIGDLGGLLFNAGRSILDGLLRGLKDMWSGVEGFFKDLTAKIPDWKGPADRDKTLLTNAGHLIMGGFLDGLESQYGAVQKSLGGFTDSLSADATLSGNLSMSKAPTYAGDSTYGTDSRTGGGVQVTQHVYPSEGMSEKQLANKAAKEFAWAF